MKTASNTIMITKIKQTLQAKSNVTSWRCQDKVKLAKRKHDTNVNEINRENARVHIGNEKKRDKITRKQFTLEKNV